MSETHQDSIASWYTKIISEGKSAFAMLPRWEKPFFVFWLFGPFILLIERSPADLWLSVTALVFLIRCFIRRDFSFLKAFWVKTCFAFWFVMLLSGALSSMPLYSLGEAFVWIRFPMFAMATMYWLGRDKTLLYLMALSTLLGLLSMCGILTAEILIEGQKGRRLMWPYGDLVPGNYVAKVGLPVFTMMVALAVSSKGRIAQLSGIVALFTMVISVMTGERINFLIRACSGMLAGLVWRINIKRYIILVIIEVLAVFLVFQAIPDTGSRYVNNFIDQLPTGNHSAYYRTMMPGVMAFEQAPILGIGTGNFRYMCDDIVGDTPNLECHPHPHNFYIQMAGETGIIGLIFGTIFLWSIIWTCFRASWKNRDNVMVATAWIVPFGLFWPVASMADLFGQWNNIFLWSAVSLALAATNLADNKQKT